MPNNTIATAIIVSAFFTLAYFSPWKLGEKEAEGNLRLTKQQQVYDCKPIKIKKKLIITKE